MIALGSIIKIVLDLYMYVIIARAILSWVNPDPYNPIVRFVYKATDPLMDKVRRNIPIDLGGIDFSPIILILGIIFLQKFVVGTLTNYGALLAG